MQKINFKVVNEYYTSGNEIQMEILAQGHGPHTEEFSIEEAKEIKEKLENKIEEAEAASEKLKDEILGDFEYIQDLRELEKLTREDFKELVIKLQNKLYNCNTKLKSNNKKAGKNWMTKELIGGEAVDFFKIDTRIKEDTYEVFVGLKNGDRFTYVTNIGGIKILLNNMNIKF